jgi:hypothetical protein
MRSIQLHAMVSQPYKALPLLGLHAVVVLLYTVLRRGEHVGPDNPEKRIEDVSHSQLSAARDGLIRN